MSIQSKTHYFVFISIIILLVRFQVSAMSSPIVVSLKCENLINPHAIDNTIPHFSWKTLYDNGSMKQTHYEIQVASDSSKLLAGDADLWNSGKLISSESVMIPYAGEALSSRALCYWRVRIWNDKEEISSWSEIARFGVGILDKNEWEGKFIGLHANAGNTETPILRKKFDTDNIYTSFLHVNTLGYHEVYLNGIKISDAVLSPAVSQLNKRSLTITYDVTDYLIEGENDLVIWLGSGWYKNSAYDMSPIKPTPSGAKVLAQLDTRVDNTWETMVITDSSWEGIQTGYKDTGSWNANNFGGERIDARLNPKDLDRETLDDLTWSEVIEMDIPDIKLTPQMTEVDKIQETVLPQSIKKISNNVWLVDMGKTVTGWFEMKMPKLAPNQSVILEYSDFIDENGVFEDQRQKDMYVASGRVDETFSNKFNYHAFRYVKITMKSEPQIENMKAHLIHTDYKSASSFECSDSDINAIHDMIKYTMTCLTYSGYMVDCPHIERAGYGGDGNSSTMSLQTMYNVSPLFNNWITAWGDAMREGGSLPYVAPNPGGGGGGPYWSGFIVAAPWRTYVNYADSRLIKKYYGAMKEWLGYVDQYTVNGLLKEWPNKNYRMWYLGDWLAPAGNSSTTDLVNNCFISQCYDVMAKMANLLNLPEDYDEFTRRKEALNNLIHRTFYRRSSKSYGTTSQLDFVYPLLVGATPSDLQEEVKEKMLEASSVKNDGHIGVGLVGVSVLTDWAIENKEVDFIYTMLKKRTYPGYLYMIDKGATTTWESWNGDRSRVHNCYNGIGVWFYQAIGGIRIDEDNPGYKHFYIDPQIPEGITWAKTTKESPYGNIKVDWLLNNSGMELEVSIPVGSTATLVVPENIKSCLVNEQDVPISEEGTILIESGDYTINMSYYYSNVFTVDDQMNFDAFPNPFSDYIVYNTPKEGELYIMDTSGCLVFNQKVNVGSNTIYTHDFPQGVYLLKNNIKTLKVVK